LIELPSDVYPAKDDKNQVIPDTFYVEGVRIGPDYRFTEGLKMTERERRLALKYLWARDGLKCSFCGADLPLGVNKLPDCDIHHSVNRHWHVAKGLKLASHECNARYGHPKASSGIAAAPASSTLAQRETEKSPAPADHAEAQANPSSMEMARSVPMRFRWLKWIRDSKNGPLANGPVRLRDLCDRAPRALARTELGEETLGVSQTYMKYATTQDRDEVGGPLHLYPRMNKETGKAEIWVKLQGEANEKGLLQTQGDDGV